MHMKRRRIVHKSGISWWKRLKMSVFRLKPTNQILFWGFIFSLVFNFFLGYLSFLYYKHSASLENQISSLENERKILIGQRDAARERIKILENIKKSSFLDYKIRSVSIRVHLKDLYRIEKLNDVRIFCELIKIGLKTPTFFIHIPDQSNIGFFSGKERINKIVLYDSWTKFGNKDYYRLQTGVSPKKGYVEGIVYIQTTNNDMQPQKVRDYGDVLLRLVVNKKCLDLIEAFELYLNDIRIFYRDKSNWKIEKTRLVDVLSEDYRKGEEGVASEEWYLLGEQREDTIGTDPFKLKLILL